jgi:small subunit ribosomal protein S20
VANHKSAIKRTKQNALRRSRNRAIRTKMKTYIKLIDAAIEENSVENAQLALKVAIPVIMKAASKGTLKKENASRKVSRLTVRVNKFVAASAA